MSVREWQEQYRAGRFNSKARSVQCEAGWYDWFCRDESLLERLKELAPMILGITESCILDNYYLWLKNNCPVNGPLYDDVRFEPLSEVRDGRYFIVQHKSPWEKHNWTLFTERSGFEKPEFGCEHVRDMIRYINQEGESIWFKLKGGDNHEA